MMMIGYFGWMVRYLFFISFTEALSSSGWQNIKDKWKRINASNILRLPSPRPNSDGYFIVVSTKTESAKLIIQTLHSHSACVGLSYSLSRGRHSIIQVKTSNSKTAYWRISRNSGKDMWNHVLINAYLSKYQIEIEGIVRDVNGYVAIDDINIKTGKICSADCNFDDGWCAWNNLGNWTRKRGDYDSGPVSDHTGGDGYYIFTKGSGIKARMSVSQKGNGYTCLTLWYYLHGDNTINFYVKTHTNVERFVHSLKSAEGKEKWTNAQIQFLEQSAYEIIVEGVIENDATGDISIDDITVKHSVCNQAENAKSSVIIYVLVPPVLAIVIGIGGVVAYIIWRKRRSKRKPYSGNTTQLSGDSNQLSSPSFSHDIHVTINSEPINPMKSISDESDYAVISDDSIKLSNEKVEYNMINTKSKVQQDNDFGYDHLRQDISDSHSSENNKDDIDIQTPENESNDRGICMVNSSTDKATSTTCPFEINNDPDDNYDHTQFWASEGFHKSDDVSHMHNTEGIKNSQETENSNNKMDTGENILGDVTRQNDAHETQLAEGRFTLDDDDSCKTHDYYILRKEDKYTD